MPFEQLREVTIAEPSRAATTTSGPPAPADASADGSSSWLLDSLGLTRDDLVKEARTLLAGAAWLIVFLLLAPIADSACGEGRCAALGAPLAQWLRLAGFARLLSPPTELADKVIFFSLRRVASAALSGDTLPTATFYLVAFEGSLGRLLWLSALAGFNAVQEHFSLTAAGAGGVEESSLGRVLGAVIAYQALCVLRNFFVRW
jgi:hypothetical protein